MSNPTPQTIEVDGVIRKVVDLSKEWGISHEALRWRIRKGWSIDRLKKKPNQGFIKGSRYGKLTVIRPGEVIIRPNMDKVPTSICKCDCGKRRRVDNNSLRESRITMCLQCADDVRLAKLAGITK